MKFITNIAVIALVSQASAVSLSKDLYGKRRIYDLDGDGVEDNVVKTHRELDEFYKPNTMFPTENIENTPHGNLPGHLQKEL